MDRPFIKLSILLIIGILVSFYIDINTIYILLTFSFTFFIVLFNILRKKDNNLLILFSVFLLGIFITNVAQNSKLVHFADISRDYTGVVKKIVYIEEKESKYIVDIENAGKLKIDEKIMLKLIDPGELQLGDRISFTGILRLPVENTNPKLFNYKLYLQTHKIHTIASIKNYNIYNIESSNTFYNKLVVNFHNRIEKLFGRYLSSNNRDLILSIILGNSSILEDEELNSFRELGLAHILAVSGLHIGIISGFLYFIFSRLTLKRKYNYILTLSILWVYGAFIGYSPSTLRGCIMISLLFLANLSHEPSDPLNTIFASMFILLILNPFYLFSVSFQLSYIATISLIVFTPKIMQYFYPYKGKVIKSMGAILSVNIGLFPISAYYFNSIPLLGLFANLISVPILSLALIFGMSMIIFSYVFPFINFVLGYFLNLLLNINSIIIKFLCSFPIISLRVFSPDVGSIFFYYIIIFIILGFLRFKEIDFKIKKFLFYYLLVIILFVSIEYSLEDELRINFIDVGQGDSILIQGKDYTYLLDTGGSFSDDFDIGENITLPYLIKNGINKLDGIIISHFDADHSQGLEIIVKNIRVKSILSGYKPIDLKYKVNIINDNSKIILDKNTYIEVLWPRDSRDIDYLSENNKSLVLLLNYYNHKVLFTGDIEKEVEREIIESLEDIDILKVAHHGSKTSSIGEFIEKTKPEYSIISVGRNNFYNHPHIDVIERLESIDSHIYRTDKMGEIEINLTKDSIRIVPFLHKKNGKLFLHKKGVQIIDL